MLKQGTIFSQVPGTTNQLLNFTGANGITAPASFSWTLGTFNRQVLNPPNRLDFKAAVNTPHPNDDMLDVLWSNVVSVNVTGEVGSTGTLSPRITFQPSSATFNNGDAIDVCESVTAALVNALPAAVGSVHFGVYVNNSANPVQNFDISRADLSSQDWCTDGFTVTAANGFINGANTITGKFVISGSSSGLGEGSATMQAQGLAAATTPPAATPGAAGATCTAATASSCQSGVCGTDGKCTAPAPGTPGSVGATPVVPNGNCTGPTPDPNYCLYNPLPVNSLGDTLLLIMRAFLGVIGVWAVAFIVIGGFRLVVSGGNEEMVTAAKKTITWAILGLVLALLSFSIIAIIQNLLGTTVKNVSSKTSVNRIDRKIG
jgi:hypothetical protein